MTHVEKIKLFMERRNITQKDMALHLEVHESQLNRWLKDKNKPSKIWERMIDLKLK